MEEGESHLLVSSACNADAFSSAHGALVERSSAPHGLARSRRTSVSTARIISGNAPLTRIRILGDQVNTSRILV